MSPGGCGGEAGDVAELVRGSVMDRPWGRTFAAFGLRGVTGQLTLVTDGKRFLVAFEAGAVVAASSPLASDAAVRVALTSHLVSSSQVSEIARRQAAAPERDEIDVIAELARLGPDHALRLRRRVIAQRAARSFSVKHGEFVVTDHTELPILPGCELDIRAVIYMGARTNLSEQRLSAELDQLGSWFRLRPGLDEDLPQFGFTDLEQPVVERLRDGGTVAEIEEFATSFVDGRTVHAVIYSLAVCNVCDLGPAAQAAPARSASSTLPPLSTGTVPRSTPAAEPGVVEAQTNPQPRAAASSSGTAGAVKPPPGSSQVHAGLGGLPTRPSPALPRRATPPPGLLASGSSVFTSLGEGLEAPTQREGRSPGLPRLPEEAVPREGSSPGLRRPLEAATPREGSYAGLRLPSEEAVLREASSPGLRQPSEEAVLREASGPGSGRPLDAATPREGSYAGLRLPSEEAMPRDRSSAGLRLPPGDAETAHAEPVILRVPSSWPPRSRRAQATDAPQSHDIKALIAQRLALLDQGADHFQLLGVAQDVSQDALRKAYFALARQLHPDRLAALGIPDDGKHAQRLFAQINAGFAILSDPARRAQYLDVLGRGGEAAVRAEQARTEELTRRILDAEEAFHRGELALRRDQPQAAVTELELAIQLNPEEADYHALLAWSQFCAAPDKMAIAPRTRVLLDRAIQRSPRAVTARFYLGRVERMLGRDQEALRHFRDVLVASPGHADAAAEQRVIEARLAGGDKPGGGLFGRFKR